MPDAIKVTGLKEFSKELRKLDDQGLIGELKGVNYDVAQLVVTTAKSRAGGVSRQAAKAALSMGAGRQAARAVVTGGGALAPFFAGAEFGSDRFRQFMPWRGAGQGAGYFVYPAIRDRTDEIVDLYGDALEKIASRAFPD